MIQNPINTIRESLPSEAISTAASLVSIPDLTVYNDNILVSFESKIADFGAALYVVKEYCIKKTTCGTLGYMALVVVLVAVVLVQYSIVVVLVNLLLLTSIINCCCCC